MIPGSRSSRRARLLDLANTYVGMWSELEYVDVWYSVPQPEAAERISSQRWHRDYNDKHLLKVFLYLVDVDESMGPVPVRRRQPAGRTVRGRVGLAAPRPELPDRGRARGPHPRLGRANLHRPGQARSSSATPLDSTAGGSRRRSRASSRPRPTRHQRRSRPSLCGATTYSGPVDALRRAVAISLSPRPSSRAAAGRRRASWPVNVPRDESPSIGVLDVERHGLVHRDVVVELRRVDRADGGVHADEPFVQEVPRDPGCRHVVARRRRRSCQPGRRCPSR